MENKAISSTLNQNRKSLFDAFKLKKTSLLILALTSLVFSRGMFWFINDPEGPNLLVVTVTAGIVYFVSLLVSLFYSSGNSSSSPRSLLPIIVIQILVVTGLYFLLKFI